MCIYSFLSTIDLCLSVNTQPREHKDTVSYLTGQIASEIVMPMNIHNQSFSVLHRECNFTSHTRGDCKLSHIHKKVTFCSMHSPQLTTYMYNVFHIKKTSIPRT